jgi:hypothetical protein
MRVVIPAYAISELKTGFQMGFFPVRPFLLIDLVVSTTLLSMGMMQLPPMMVSLPFKVLLFVMIGWLELTGRIVGQEFSVTNVFCRVPGFQVSGSGFVGSRFEAEPRTRTGNPGTWNPGTRKSKE